MSILLTDNIRKPPSVRRTTGGIDRGNFMRLLLLRGGEGGGNPITHKTKARNPIRSSIEKPGPAAGVKPQSPKYASIRRKCEEKEKAW